MIRELFHIGPVGISPFGVLLMLAFLGAYAQLSWGLRRSGAGDADDASAVVLGAGFGGIVGAKVYYAFLYQDWRLLFDRSGLVWYGGFIGGTLAVLWIVHRRRLPGWRTADAGALGLAVGYAVGRIGCFLVGDDYGVPTDLPWGVAFPVGLPPTKAFWLESEFGVDIPPGVDPDTLLAVHPTQLYESAAALFIWTIGMALFRRGAPPGKVTLVVVGLLAVERFAVEFLRAKDDRFFGALTLAQLISLAVVVAVVALGATLRRRWASEITP